MQNKNIVEIKNNDFRKYINIDRNKFYKVNDIYFSIEKYKLDINGNRLYKIVIENNRGENINHLFKNKLDRNYLKKGYSITSAANIYIKLEYLFNNKEV